MPSVMIRMVDLSAAWGLYDLWARRSLTPVHETLVELADLHGSEQILDVGCGTGLLCSRFAGVADRIVVRGVDIGSNMIRAARKRERRRRFRAEYQAGTVTKLPYSNGQFDVVSSCLLFHLLEDPEKKPALQEIFRVLKPAGRYVCAEFEMYPVGCLHRRLAEYPSDLIGIVGFRIQTQLMGPFLTRRRPIVYRVLVKPE